MTQYLHKQILVRRARLDELADAVAKLERERAVVEAEIGAYQDALAHLSGSEARDQQQAKGKRGGRRGLSPHWKAVIADMAKTSPQSTGYARIEMVLKSYGKSTRRPNLRRHILSYVEMGYIERVRDGQFLPTEKGLKAAGLLKRGGSAPAKDETPDVSASSVSPNGSGGGSPLSVERQEPRLLT